MKKKIVHEIKSLLLITVATLIYAVGISLFLDPNQLAPGGVTGIAVILNRLVNIETGTLYFLLNLPLVRPAVPGQSLLDLHGRILKQSIAFFDQRQ